MFSFMSWPLALRSLTIASSKPLIRFSRPSQWILGSLVVEKSSSEGNGVPRFQVIDDFGNPIGNFLVGQGAVLVQEMQPIGKASGAGRKICSSVNVKQMDIY